MLRKVRSGIRSIFRLDNNLILLFAVGAIAVIGLQFIQPLFPVFLQSLNASEMEISLTLSISSLGATLFLIPAGYLIDRLGEKKMLLIGISIWAFSTLLIAFTKDWRFAAFLYMFHGIADAFVGPSRMTLISSISTQSSEATTFGLMSLDWVIGGTIAPPLSGHLAERYSWQLPLLIASAAFFISIIPLLKLRTVGKRSDPIENDNVTLGYEAIRFLPAFLYFMFGFLLNSAQSMISTMLPLFLKNQLSISATIIGLFFTTSTLMGALTQVPGGLVADKFGKKRVIMLLLLPVPLIYRLWGSVNAWYGYLVLFALSKGLIGMTGAASLAIVSEVFPEERKGSAFSLWMAGIRTGSALGPLLGGYLYAVFGDSSPFVGSGVIFALSIPFIYFLKSDI
jgi:DHA1 family multidrug resistance protein-like MFS transporter